MDHYERYDPNKGILTQEAKERIKQRRLDGEFDPEKYTPESNAQVELQDGNKVDISESFSMLFNFTHHDLIVWIIRLAIIVVAGVALWFLISRYGSFIKAQLEEIPVKLKLWKTYLIWTAVVIITVLLIILLIVLIIFVVTLLTR